MDRVKYVCIEEVDVYRTTINSTRRSYVGDIIWVRIMKHTHNMHTYVLYSIEDSNRCWYIIDIKQLDSFQEYREHIIDKILE